MDRHHHSITTCPPETKLLWMHDLHFKYYLTAHPRVSVSCRKYTNILLWSTEALKSSTYHS